MCRGRLPKFEDPGLLHRNCLIDSTDGAASARLAGWQDGGRDKNRDSSFGALTPSACSEHQHRTKARMRLEKVQPSDEDRRVPEMFPRRRGL